MTAELSGRMQVYTNQVPYESDILNTGRFKMSEVGALAETILGFGPGNPQMVCGFACNPVSPPGMAIVVGPGIMYSYEVYDATAFGVLPADTNANHKLYKQGFNWDPVTLNVTAPATGGQSVIYLVQAQFQTQDVNNVSRPYFNSDNPAEPIFQNNYDTRQDIAIITIKQGTPGVSPTPPTPDAGHLGLWYVTVANGQTSIVSGNIAKISTVEGQPFITEGLTQKLGAGDLSGLVTQSQLQSTQFVKAIAGGSANAITASPSPAYTSLGRISIFAENTNTGPATLNVSSSGAIAIRVMSPSSGLVPLVGGEIATNGWYDFYYDGTYWQLLNPAVISLDLLRNLDFIAAADIGSANSIVVSPIPAYVLSGKTQIWVIVEHENTGATTITINSILYNVRKKDPVGNGTPILLTGGELVAGGYFHFIWDGTYFELQNPASYLEIQNYQNLKFISVGDTGSVNTVVANPSIPYKSYTGFTQIWVFIENNNTGPSTLNVSGLGALSITKKSERGGAPITLTGGEMLQSTWAHFIYNGTSVELINPAPIIDGTSSYDVDSSGTANIIIANPTIPYSTYAPGTHVRVQIANTNTGASTLNISTLGAVNIQKMTITGLSNVIAGNLRSGGIYDFTFDGTQFQVLNPT